MLRNEKSWQSLGDNNYYQHSANAREYIANQGLMGTHRFDVAIVGAGFSGLSAGLALAKRGFRVALLEGKEVGFGASGRNGGQVLVGYACGQAYLEKQLGFAQAKRLWEVSLDAVQQVKSNINEYQIACDWQDGFYYAGVKASSSQQLQRDADYFARHYDFHQTYIPKEHLHDHIQSSRYIGALQEDVSGHFHPLNYQLGLAKVASEAGCKIFEHAEVHTLMPSSGSSPHCLKTATGEIKCDYVLLAGNALLGNVSPEITELSSKILPVCTYIGATAPLTPDSAQRLIAGNRCVCDNQFVLDYFRLSADHRLLFGGRVNYTSRIPKHLSSTMHQSMTRVFPQLANVPMEFAWGGYVDITLSRAPHFGQLRQHPSIYFVQGFSGHGAALAGMAGTLMAESMVGLASRWDAFSTLPHASFPGGSLFHAPLYALGMLYFRLKDWF